MASSTDSLTKLAHKLCFYGAPVSSRSSICGVWVRRVFLLFFSMTLVFLRPPCSTYHTSKTHWTGLISAVLRRHRALSANIEFLSKFALWILVTPKPRSVFISSTLTSFSLGDFLMIPGERTQRWNVKFLTSYHVVYSSGPLQPQPLGPSQVTTPSLSPTSATLAILPGVYAEAIWKHFRLINNAVDEI